MTTEQLAQVVKSGMDSLTGPLDRERAKDTVGNIKAVAFRFIAYALAEQLHRENREFDRDSFLRACGAIRS